MSLPTILEAAILGVVEGMTEFIPVSSTAHLLLLGELMGFDSPGKAFEVLVQLGAVLAILLVYAQRITSLLVHLTTTGEEGVRARHFAIAVLVAFFPAALIGALAHGFIKTVLFHSPLLICTMLIVGGIILLVVDRLPLRPNMFDVEELPIKKAFLIGLCQCLAMIPGVSRSGATIVSAMLMGADKRTAAEFSFYLAMPTMAGAFVYDLYKSRSLLSFNDGIIIAIGFATAFVSALIVVRWLLSYVSQHGFALFGWWRIVVGSIGLIGIALLG
jgi:undecaprenyl-diphosphatase